MCACVRVCVVCCACERVCVCVWCVCERVFVVVCVCECRDQVQKSRCGFIIKSHIMIFTAQEQKQNLRCECVCGV